MIQQPVRRRDGIVQRYNFKGKSPVKTFRINDEYYIEAQAQDTRSGFRHIAVLYASQGRIPLDEAKVTYQNRTWESYEFESVIRKLLDETDALTQEEKASFLNKSGQDESKRVESQFRTMGNIAALGDVFARTPEERVAWKLRMIKAGTGNMISLPSDWEELSVEEQERRLDGIINMTKGGS